MNNSQCEQSSSCDQFQIAVCLHCNLRLCLTHIAEHNQIVSLSFQNLSDEVEATFQYVQDEFQEHKNRSMKIIASIDQWRQKKIEEIEQTYQKKLKSVESEGKIVNEFQENLFKQLQHDARQPLEQMTNHQHASITVIHSIQQTIERVRQESVRLKEKYPLNITMREGIEIDSIPDSMKISKKSLSKEVKVQPRFRAPKRLVQMLKNLSSIERSQNNIDHYIQKQGHAFRLSTLINSYLTAWHDISKARDKICLLNAYLSTIQKHLARRHNGQDILKGLQFFFFYENIQENRYDMMTFLLQYFLNHQCLHEKDLFQWYHQQHSSKNHPGLEQAKLFATPLIQSLTTMELGQLNIQ